MGDAFTLGRFAAVSARLEAGQPRDAVLAAMGLSEADWLAGQRAWLERLATQVRANRFQLLTQFLELLEEERFGLGTQVMGGLDRLAPPPMVVAQPDGTVTTSPVEPGPVGWAPAPGPLAPEVPLPAPPTAANPSVEPPLAFFLSPSAARAASLTPTSVSPPAPGSPAAPAPAAPAPAAPAPAAFFTSAFRAVQQSPEGISPVAYSPPPAQVVASPPSPWPAPPAPPAGWSGAIATGPVSPHPSGAPQGSSDSAAAGHVPGAPPAATPPGFFAAAGAAGAPSATAAPGSPSSAPPPVRLSLEQYAHLTIELERGGNTQAVLTRYHLTPIGRYAEDLGWQQRFAAEPTLHAQFMRLVAAYRTSPR
ncbi:MAG: hypothetical protein JW751_16535 [Polyangiaceae bacterium]|nr:hypothetical protein [Polyangiaceae bacterium]